MSMSCVRSVVIRNLASGRFPMPRWRLGMILVLLLLGPASIVAQNDPDSLRTERLIALGKLWADIELFHPYLAYRDIDWDAALVEAIPKVNAGPNREYIEAIKEMLDVLEDPATHIVQAEVPGRPSDQNPHPVSEWTSDSLLIVHMTNYSDLVDRYRARDQLEAIGEQIPSAGGIVFDIRRKLPGEAGSLRDAFTLSEISARLTAREAISPAERFRMHSGLRQERGAAHGGYYSAFRLVDGEAFLSKGSAASKPIVFLANEESELPEVALALQGSGQAIILFESEPNDVSVITRHHYHLPGDIEVAIRLSERVYADGHVGFVPDSILPTSEGSFDSSALQSAIQAARHPVLGKLQRKNGSPLASIRHRPSYDQMLRPPLGYRLLAGFRIWSVIRSFFPYLNLIEEDWDSVLREFITKLEAASDSMDYALTVAEMVTHIHDTHGFMWSPVLGEYFGTATPPIRTRLIEGLPVVTHVLESTGARSGGIETGDIVLTVDGESARERMSRLARYISASTPQASTNSVMQRWLAGSDSSVVRLSLRGRDGRVKAAELLRSRSYWSALRDQRDGDIVRMVRGNIGYADLDRLTITMVDSMFAMFRGSPAIVFDMRGYPKGTAWSIAPRLTDEDMVPAAQFRVPVRMGPDTTESTSTRSVQYIPSTDKSRYHGRTVMLIDERTISQAEHTGLFFEAANDTKFVGTPTAGANGEVTNFVVPGGITISFTGAETSYADGRQLQRIGLVPDLYVEPTIEGIRAGRDEVLEAALDHLTEKVTRPIP